MKIDEAMINTLKEFYTRINEGSEPDLSHMIVYKGDINIIADCATKSGIYERAQSNYGSHPTSVRAKVWQALDRSDKFMKTWDTEGHVCYKVVNQKLQ